MTRETTQISGGWIDEAVLEIGVTLASITGLAHLCRQANLEHEFSRFRVLKVLELSDSPIHLSAIVARLNKDLP